jgi:hypothetical protein
VDDEWIGEYAEGVPTKEYNAAKIEKNPNYGLTITKPGKGYVVLRLKEKVSPFQSVQSGFLCMQANKGEVIKELRVKSSP